MIINKLEQNFKKLVVVFLFLFLSFISGFFPGFGWDVQCWATWSAHMCKHGLSQTYDAYLNTYMPLYQYILYLFGKVAGSEDAIKQGIGYVRVITLLFEFAGLWYVYKWIDKKLSYHLIVLFAMLNIAYSYNTMIWGQVDGISSALGFATMYYGTTRRPVLSALFMVLAVNMKLQMIIFVPVWGLLYLFNVAQDRSWKTFLLPLLVMAVGQAVLLAPFSFYEKGLQQVYDAAFTSVGQFPKVSAFAFNIWYWLCPTAPSDTIDSTVFMLDLTYKNVGLLLFFTSSFLVMLPLIVGVIRKMLGKGTHIWPSRELVWLVCSLIPLFFFFFNTQMHERYCHPAYIFLTAYALYSNYWLPYVFFSVAYLLNLERVMTALKLNNYSVFIFDPRFVSSLYAVCILLLIIRLVKLNTRLQDAPLATTHQKSNVQSL